MSKFTIEATARTFATEANAEKAVIKAGFDHLRFFIMPTKDGRCFPVFCDRDAMDEGVHFHFHVIGY